MGVITTGVIPAGKVFGPIPSNLTLSDPALLIGHMTCDNRPDIHTVKINLNECTGEHRGGEWIPYIQPARDEREQNLEAFLRDGQLHYRTTRTIGSGEEVQVWYSKEMAAAIGVPELMPFHIREGGQFFCPYCMETFRYPNSLRAHMRFKCEHRRQIHPMGLSALRPPGPIPREVHERLFPGMTFDYRTAGLEKATHGAFPYPGYPNFRLSLPTNLPTTSAADLQGAMLPSPASSSSSTGLSLEKNSPTASERSMEVREGWNTSRSSPGKRSLDDPEPEMSAKRHASGGSSPSKSSCPPSPVQERPRSTDSQHSLRSNSGRRSVGGSGGGDSPISVCGSVNMEPKLDRNQNISSDVSDDENLSAFRKVEKRVDIGSPINPAVDSTHSPPSTLFSPTPINGLKHSSAPNLPTKTFPSTLPHPSFLPRLALLPGNAGMPPSFMPGTNNYNENLPLNMSDLYRNSLNAKFGSELSRPASEKLADIRNIENNNLHTKMAFLSNPARTMSMRMSSYYKSHNPMVEKLLTTPAIPQAAPFTMALTQNWCAKCNATFRMTSDLVYHMRSQHKQEPAVKKKREDKLKCTVCGETFRERHHLTRHMTSHQ